MNKVDQPIWISGSEKLPIMYMSESHIQNAINKLNNVKGKTFKRLNKEFTLKALNAELEYRKKATEVITNILNKRIINKYNVIYQEVCNFTKLIGMKHKKSNIVNSKN